MAGFEVIIEAIGRLGWVLCRIEKATGVRRENRERLLASGRDRSVARGQMGESTAKSGQRRRGDRRH
jgi:hypothetical protein